MVNDRKRLRPRGASPCAAEAVSLGERPAEAALLASGPGGKHRAGVVVRVSSKLEKLFVGQLEDDLSGLPIQRLVDEGARSFVFLDHQAEVGCDRLNRL